MPENRGDGAMEAGDFAVFLSTVRPHTNNEVGEALAGLVGAVRDTGKSGTLTLTVTVKPLDGDPNVLQVFDQIKVKRPEHDRKGSLAYPDKGNRLSRTDPNSLPLFSEESIREAPAAAEKPKEL